MRRIFLSPVLGLFMSSPAMALTLTGNVPDDFDAESPHTVVTREDEPDIGMPDNFPDDAVSGLDIAAIWVDYDADQDLLTIGFETFGIGGDVDGDGDPGGTSDALAANGGRDNPDFGETEGFVLYIDTDNDGEPDVAAGKPAQSGTDISDYQVATFNTAFIYSPTLAFDEILPEHTGSVYASPNAAEPHLEFTIVNVSSLPGMPEGFDPMSDGLSIGIGANMSSLEDDGIGEDYVPGAGATLTIELAPPMGSIIGSVFYDLDGDGVQGPDEAPFPGVGVGYVSSDGTASGSATTDEGGVFQFADLVAQTYLVEISAPFGYAPGIDTPIEAPVDAYTETDLGAIGLYPTDTDGDGILDVVEGQDDDDGDGLANYLDLDADGDGFPDALEAAASLEDPPDADGDGRPDFLDRDSDDDGLVDALEGGQDTNGDGLFESADDTDGDGVPDYLDPDSDNDELNDGLEAGVSQASADSDTNTASPNFVPDADPSHISDPDDMDSDDDCIADGVEDANHDGALDRGETAPDDADTDDDGLQDGTELGYTTGTADTAEGTCIPDADAGATTTDPTNADTDDGGVADGLEDANHNGMIDPLETNPNDPADDLDADGDGLSTDLENDIGTDPFDPDTDDDGIYDGADGIEDPDGDGAINALDLDSDGDGHPDAEEAADPETGEIDPTSPYDFDEDGTPDHIDLDSDDDGLLDEDESSDDHDGDGAAGIHDPDADNDGIYDGTEAGITDPSADTDTDSGVFVPDSDPDTTTDPEDADSDDDGILDGNEDADADGARDDDETDPANPDTDGDCIQDGTELGLIEPQIPDDSTLEASDTDLEVFVPDEDPGTTTDPLLADTDAGGADDGQEDGNCDGAQAEGESDPNDPSDDLPPQDSDEDGILDDDEIELGTDPNDADSDDDGILDGDEAIADEDGDGLIDPLDPDADGDGIQDGTESGITADDVGPDTDLDTFIPDADPNSTTDPHDADTDDDGLDDGDEDADGNGALDQGETDPGAADTDGDGIQDGTESGITGDDVGPDTDLDTFIPDADPNSTTDPLDDDSDDDGLLDGSEDADRNGARDDTETDPLNPDTDEDCILDGTELGLIEPEGNDTDTSVFVPDADPSTTTDPLAADTDGGSVPDGGAEGEDSNCNGIQESGETDPNDASDDVESTPAEDASPTPLVEETPTPGDEIVVLGGGGCSELGCSTAGASRPGAQGALFLMAGALIWTWRRRRRRSILEPRERGNARSAVPIEPSRRLRAENAKRTTRHAPRRWTTLGILLLTMPAAGELRAQSVGAVEVQHFHPAEDLSGAIRTEGTRLVRPGGLALGIWVNYADDPLVVWRGGEKAEKLQDSVLGLDLIGVYGISRRLQVNVGIPATLYQNIVTGADLNADAAPVALNDPSLAFKIGVVTPEGTGFGLALEPRVWLPLGRAGSYTGGSGSAAFSLLADRRFGSGLWMGGRLGYRYRPEAQPIGPLIVDDEVVYSLGAALPLGEMHLLMDLFGRLGTAAIGDGSVADAPLEFMVGIARPLRRSTLTVGISTGLVAGYGAPDVRLVAGITLGTERTSDRDRDGIRDAIDRCPDTPEDFDQVEDQDGCPEDNDRDGIPDKEDECPSAPEDFDHFEDDDGCPDSDNDRDYVPDVADQCPNDPEDRDRFEDDDGCPDEDNDRDGIVDVSDRCPNDPEDKDGFQDEDGCPDPDNDQDTIPDDRDQCPMVPETMNGDRDDDGCPEQIGEVKVEDDRLILLEKIHFDFDKATIRKESYPILDNAIKVFKSHPTMRVRIEGHTDSRGSASYNLELSRRRAEAVMRYVIEKGGLDPTRFEALGRGETQPVASNDTDEGRAKNRRIEWIILSR